MLQRGIDERDARTGAEAVLERETDERRRELDEQRGERGAAERSERRRAAHAGVRQADAGRDVEALERADARREDPDELTFAELGLLVAIEGERPQPALMRRGNHLVLAVEVVHTGVKAEMLERRTADEDRFELAVVDALAQAEVAQRRRLAQRTLDAGLHSVSEG